MRRHRGLAALAALAGLVSLWSAGAPPSSGEEVGATVTKVAWWTRQPAARPQPEGGFQVSLAVDGPESVAAVEAQVADGEAVTVGLTLKEGVSVGAERAALQVCTTAASWEPANPGDLAAAPITDCSRAVRLTRDPASTSWQGDVSTLVDPGGTVGLAVLPVAQPVGGVADPGVRLTVASATLKAESTVAAGDFVAPAPESGGAPSSGGDASLDFGSGSFDSGSSSVASGAFDTPLPPTNVGAPPSATPAAAAPPVAAAGSTEEASAPRAEDTGGGSGRPWGRLLVFLPLSVAIGATATLARRRFPALAT